MKQSDQEPRKATGGSSLKAQAEAAKAKARESLKNPAADEKETDGKMLAKGQAVRKH